MPLKRNKRKNAHEFSQEVRRRLYKGAAFATLAYVVLSLIRFHGQFPYLPYELAIIWAVFLLCYTSIKEVLRWNEEGGEDEEVYHGELWATIILAGAAWMILWNIGRTWIFRLPQNPFPEDYEAAAIETIVLYTLSIISSFLYKYKFPEKRPVKHKRQKAKAIRREPTPALFEKALPASASDPQPAKVDVVLTKAPAVEEKSKSAPKDS